MAALLSVEDIHTYYGDSYILQGLSLEVREGEALGVLGRNGMGKTTLINSIMGFVQPRRGRIVFQGKDITRTPSFETCNMGIGLCPQGRRVFPTLTVRENLLVAHQARNGKSRWDLSAVYELFPRLGERHAQRAGSLSGGEQQMLAVARALVTNPACLILDEPSEGLAPLIIQHMGEAIRKLREEGLAILLVEQNTPFALKVVDRVNIVTKGRVVHDLSPEALWANEEIKHTHLGIG
ncbi:MAG: ABC transporter ATP-binding protein [Candidatus Tectomicrobia bacterium]|uniref:ABC transporter ATP-binding protein n=1 Tax=Tectimicrobiota bacterium TaxID=2528274 RepID=A0A932I039_UNCTE|nr:ABC transporter ATP-binding protein [Candidatus Tectomicrobia bacterium]